MALTHISGPYVRMGCHRRQRCSWCGHVLIDLDLTRVAVLDTDPHPEPASWPMDSLVRVEGNASWTVEPEEDPDHPGEYLAPDDSCLRLPPELTLAVEVQD